MKIISLAFAFILISGVCLGETTAPMGDVSADALKADLNGTNTAFTVANWIAVSNTTTYVAALVWDATNKVFIITETEE